MLKRSLLGFFTIWLTLVSVFSAPIQVSTALAEDTACDLGNGSVDGNLLLQACASFLNLATPSAKLGTKTENALPITISWKTPLKEFQVTYLGPSQSNLGVGSGSRVVTKMKLKNFTVSRITFSDKAGSSSETKTVASNLAVTATSFRDQVSVEANSVNSYQYKVTATYVFDNRLEVPVDSTTPRFEATSQGTDGSAAATNQYQPTLSDIREETVKYNESAKTVTFSQINWTTPTTSPDGTPKYTLTISRDGKYVVNKGTANVQESAAIANQQIARSSSATYVVKVKANHTTTRDAGMSNAVNVTVAVDKDGKTKVTSVQEATESEVDKALGEENKIEIDPDDPCGCKSISKDGGWFSFVAEAFCTIPCYIKQAATDAFTWLIGALLPTIEID